MMGTRVRYSLVVCEAHPGRSEGVAQALAGFGYDVRCCGDEEALIEAVSSRHPTAVVYELHHQVLVDLAILALVRRVLPDIPLVLVAGETAEPTVHALRAIHPAVVAHGPVGPDDLREALRGVIRSAARRMRAHAGAGVTALA